MIENQPNKINERFKAVRVELRLGQKEFALKAKIHQSQVSEIEKNRKNITPAIIISLEDNLNVNRKWLEHGEGDMFLNALNDHEVIYQPKTPGKKYEINGVPVYYGNVKADPAFYVDIPQFNDCKFGKMIFDNAMAPTIQSGACVFCKEITDRSIVVYGEPYYIETDNYEIVRRLQKGTEKGEVLALADNNEAGANGNRRYEPINLPLGKVKAMYIIKGQYNQSHN